MRKVLGIFVSLAIFSGFGGIAVRAEETAGRIFEYRLADTPTKYGFKGLYTLFSPDTYRQGRFGFGVYWDMARFGLPGDPRYPQVQEFTLAGAYGLTDRLEVGIALPFRSLNLPAASTANRAATDVALADISNSGISNVSVGLRYNLYAGDSFAMTPYLLAFLPTTSDPEKGPGAKNTRIHLGVSAGTVARDAGDLRWYGQAAYQFAAKIEQARRDFTETTPAEPSSQPRFDQFGANPLWQEYGNALFYGVGLALPFSAEDTFEIFGEIQAFHSFEKKDTLPLFEDGNALDDVQDGGLAQVGAKVGFANGLVLTAGWGGILFGQEPVAEAPTWKVFAGLTYHRPEMIIGDNFIEPPSFPENPSYLERPKEPIKLELNDWSPEVICPGGSLAMIQFEFDKSTLTPESIMALRTIAQYLRLCPDVILEVQGHTDWIGTENYNLGLANRRARAAVYYLVYDEGIDPKRIVLAEKRAKGIIAGETYGESKPINSNDTDTGRMRNRRVQFAKTVEH